jgi:hypothetical protein
MNISINSTIKRVRQVTDRVNRHFHYDQLKTYVEAMCIPVAGIIFMLTVDSAFNPSII